jgi:hypothetical protein
MAEIKPKVGGLPGFFEKKIQNPSYQQARMLNIRFIKAL